MNSSLQNPPSDSYDDATVLRLGERDDLCSTLPLPLNGRDVQINDEVLNSIFLSSLIALLSCETAENFSTAWLS
jgi:hypothetical protein